jgi:hypothetical protein
MVALFENFRRFQRLFNRKACGFCVGWGRVGPYPQKKEACRSLFVIPSGFEPETHSLEGFTL